MKRAILLQIEPTASKRRILEDFNARATALGNFILSKNTNSHGFHNSPLYRRCKDSSGFNTQVVTAISREVFLTKGDTIRHLNVKFNVPRNCKTFSAKSLDFVELGLYPRKRIAIPLRKNRNYDRYINLLENGWVCKTYGLTSGLQIVAYLSKEDTSLPQKRNILGIDVNSKCFAVTVMNPKGKVLKQTYFGKDIWIKRKKIFKRKSILQSYANTVSDYARKALRRTKTDEHNFVKNRIGEVVRDITNLAIEYDADIGIENLKRFSPKGRRFNREVLRIPFFAFKNNLISRCFDKGITLNIVDSWHTSKWCSRCGAVGKWHSPTDYPLFICKERGQTVNSDRKASLAVAAKTLLGREVPNQKILRFPNRRVPVNGLIRPDAVVEPIVAVRHVSSTYGKPTLFMGG